LATLWPLALEHLKVTESEARGANQRVPHT